VNIGEANATYLVLGWLRRLTITSDPDIGHEEIDALRFLTERAYKTLAAAAPELDPLAVVERLRAADSDGAAQAVCRALAAHEAHGGSIPWPSVRGSFEDWQAAHVAAGDRERPGPLDPEDDRRPPTSIPESSPQGSVGVDTTTGA
jgi:hypothetical protein